MYLFINLMTTMTSTLTFIVTNNFYTNIHIVYNKKEKRKNNTTLSVCAVVYLRVGAKINNNILFSFHTQISNAILILFLNHLNIYLIIYEVACIVSTFIQLRYYLTNCS